MPADRLCRPPARTPTRRWQYGDTGYTSIASGTTTAQSISRSVSLSDFDVDSSYRITVTASAPLYTPTSSSWWAIINRPSGFITTTSLEGPLLGAPTIASASGTTSALTINLQLMSDAPVGTTVLYYVVKQYHLTLQPETILDSSGTSTTIIAPANSGWLDPLVGLNKFTLDVYATAAGFYRCAARALWR
jgi:hypothetical protein